MKKIFAIAVTLLLMNSSQVLAGSTRTIYSQDANSNFIELKVWSGYGLIINLMATGESVKQVWIGDPTRFAFTSNGNLCPQGGDEPDCSGGKATVIFLRQIKPIKFPALTSSKNGSTQITVLTNQNQYQFKLTPAVGEPSYTSLVIKPNSEKPQPLLLNREQTQPTVVEKPILSEEIIPIEPEKISVIRSTPRTTPGGSIQRNDANAIVAGLVIGHHNGQIKRGSIIWKKAQDAIRFLRQGKSKEEAISSSQIDAQVFYQLIEWGQ
jgi:hypothetical protein